MKNIIFSIIIIILISCQSQNKNNLAKEIHDKVIIIDTHNDIDVINFTDSINYTSNTDTQVNLPKMIEGGLDVSWLIVYTKQGELDQEGFIKAEKNAMAKFGAISRLVNDYAPDQIELAKTASDVKRIWESGKKVAMIGVENAYPMGLDTSNVKKFYDLGARYVSLAHNGHNQFSDSNTGEKDNIWLHNGISDLGRQIIEKLNYYGIMIDLSHPSKMANLETIKLSVAPVIASHSSARSLCDHSRNLDDEQLLAIKENGGVVQTVALGGFLNSEKTAKNKQSNIVDLIDHVDYMVKLIGVDHVGISSDFDGGGGIEGWNDASETLNVTKELVNRGYNEKDIEKIWGGNLLRVMEEVEIIAQKLQKK